MNNTTATPYFFDGTNRIVLDQEESKRLLARLDMNSPSSPINTQTQIAATPAPKNPWRTELNFIDQSLRKMCEALGLFKKKERAIVENAADLICSLDRNLRFTDTNAASTKLLGYYPEMLMLKTALDLVIDEEKDQVRNHLQSAFSTAGRSHFESTLRKSNGELLSVSWSVSAVPKENAIYAVVQDITHRKQLEQVKRDFLAMVSHDLRAPLGNIQLVLSLIEADGGEALSQPCKRSLSIAKDNTLRLMALVNNLLDIERIDAGALAIVPEQTPIKRAINRAIDALAAMYNERGIYVIEDADETVSAYFDEERIVQVLINLLSNSLKFSPAQTAIRVKVETNFDSITVKIIDQGRGIPADKLNSIFERFSQVEAGDCRQGQGAGLGLTISKAIIEEHGGKIGAKSNLAEGSTFWFTLPRSAGR